MAVPADRIQILRGRVDRVTFPEALSRIRQILHSPGPHQIVTANTLMLLASEKDGELCRILDSAALVVPESWGVAWASRRLDSPLPEFIPGIDLFSALCRLACDEKR